jgi:hypothetical protein
LYQPFPVDPRHELDGLPELQGLVPELGVPSGRSHQPSSEPGDRWNVCTVATMSENGQTPLAGWLAIT